MKTLLEVLQKADAIEIADNLVSCFIRRFKLNDKAEKNDVMLHVRHVSDDLVCQDFWFTKNQLSGAIFRSEINKWTVRDELTNELFFIGAYFVRSINLKP